ncbi:MAG: protein-glutamate O-methyltransferase [Roseiflexaceae bacterium]|nr:protein-glutamate O-methyltransferase [Roseiflexaceae bacterium]
MTRSPKQTAVLQARIAQLQLPAVPLDETSFVRLRDQLSRFSGVYLDGSRRRILEQAVATRLAATALDVESYLRQIAENRDELRQLTTCVLNHETFFFRNQPHMRALQAVLLPELHRRKPPGEPIRIWSAGCATGEEAYSLAITALECFPLGGRTVEIWATDLSDAALEQAQRGFYSGRSLVKVSEQLLERYFQSCGGGYTIHERVRALVRFERLNIVEPPPPSARDIDIIFCQNVIIYFQPETARAVLQQFYQLLPVGGMLFLGFSETIRSSFDSFRTREVLGAYVYYKEAEQARRETKPLTLPVLAKPAPIQPRTRPVAAAQAIPLARPDPAAAHDQTLQRSPHGPLAAPAGRLAAQLLADRGQTEQALAAAKRVVALDPLDAEAALLLGTLYGLSDMGELAVEYLERARYLDGAAPIPSFRLAEAYRRQNRDQLALREYRATLRKLQPFPPDTVLGGVAVGWLRETCERHTHQLGQQNSGH